jgi:drug/metabolite transporter (DMT)-like permease
MPNDTRSAAYALLLFTALLWAGNAIAGKLAVGHVSPFLLTWLRWAIALAILIVIAWRHVLQDWPVIRANLPFLFALGALGFTMFNVMFYFALNHTSAINVAIEQSAMPLVVFLLNFLWFGIRASWRQVVGFILTVLGVVLTVTRGAPLSITQTPLNIGDVLMVIAISLYGVYSVALVKRPAMHWLSFLTTLSVAALITSIPFAFWEIASGTVIWPDAQGWAVAVFTALGPAILAQLSWARGLELIGSNRGGVFINIVPIFAALMAVVLLGDEFRLYHAAAMILVFAGVWLSQQKARRDAAAG